MPDSRVQKRVESRSVPDKANPLNVFEFGMHELCVLWDSLVTLNIYGAQDFLAMF